MVETDVVQRPVETVTCKEIAEAMQKMTSGKATELPEVSVKMIPIVYTRLLAAIFFTWNIACSLYMQHTLRNNVF